MAEEIVRWRSDGSTAMLADMRNPQHPFLKGVFVFAERYEVGSDFTSGNNLRVDIDGAQEILFAIAKTPSSTFITITETDLATETSDNDRQGRSLTLGTATTDVELFVVARV